MTETERVREETERKYSRAILFLVVLLMLFSAFPQAFSAERSLPEIAQSLTQSVGLLKQEGRGICTAWKIGARQWATAWHCVAMTGKKFSIVTNEQPLGRTLNARSILLPAEKGANKDNWEDWALINVNQSSEGVPALAVDCSYVPVLGEGVSYAGYPGVGQDQMLVYSTSIVANVTRTVDRKFPWAFVAAMEAGGGASGSPVVAHSTGKVIGFVTRGIQLTRGRVLTGIEGVAGMDMCEDAAAQADDAGEADAKEPVFNTSF